MDNQLLTLSFASSLTNLCEVNSSFDTGVLRICYSGQNRNKSSISKDALIKAIPTIYNCPVVGNYDRGSDSFGGHDIEIVSDSDGNMRLVNVTMPLGVVPESAKTWFENVEEDDGTVHEYLYTEVLLWKRQEAYQKIKEDGISAHSMEIKVKSGKRKDGVFEIEDFEFNAFCIIGTTPCFESSSLSLYSLEDFKNKMSEMMQDYKNFNLVNSSNEDNNTHSQEKITEGGKTVLDEKMELVAKYGFNVDTLGFSIEDLTIEELTEKFEAMKNNLESQEKDSFALTQNIIDEIIRELSAEKVKRDWGETSRFAYVDCDMDVSEVYAWDKNDWLLYGFTFSKDGDAIKIDFASQKRKKFTIVDFEGVEQPSPIASVFEQVDEKIRELSEFKFKFEEASIEIESMKNELGELREFKENTENEVAQGKRDELFAQFEDLNGIDAFEELRKNCKDYDLEVLEEKCYAIRGKNGNALKFSAKEISPRIKIVKQTSDNKNDVPYGGIVEKFSNKH